MLIVHHLSHIDLDGYGAQFIAREFFENIRFYNANYGKEVGARLKQILRNIASNSVLGMQFRTCGNFQASTDLSLVESPKISTNTKATPQFAEFVSEAKQPSLPLRFCDSQNLVKNQSREAQPLASSGVGEGVVREGEGSDFAIQASAPSLKENARGKKWESKADLSARVRKEIIDSSIVSLPQNDKIEAENDNFAESARNDENMADSANCTKNLILITDLNLTPSEAKFLQSEVDLLNAQGKKVQILLLDHHITGKECAQNHAWYHLDESICATKITFQYLSQNLAQIDADSAKNAEILRDSTKMQRFAKFVDMIDSADTWKEDGFAFEFGKVALGMIAQSKEFSRYMFDEFDNKFRFALLEKAQEYLLDSANEMRENAAVALDNNIFLFKKDILGGRRDEQTMEQILSHKQAELLRQNKEKYLVKCEDKKGIVTYGIGGISVVANLFLRQNADLDFFIDVGLRGNVSLRANGNCDVSEMAKEYFSGGGHKNASGGRIEGFKETFLYSEAKAQVEAIFKNEVEDEDDEQWGL